MDTQKTGISDVKATIAGKNILLKIAKDKADISFLRSLGRVRWDTAAFCWIIPAYKEIMDKMNYNITGLSNISSIGGRLFIGGNDTLLSLTGLNELTYIGDDLVIQLNYL